ncbi:ATP-dependent DNA helicase RecG [Desulfatibacillum alkenivorans DSM 16219]|jgi:ATP-dependent DNA helicase RecG|uniref:ATP-dependent DNA helicase RecG n=1 Tax=Desulfatibacillum alkenivorans DSM 16219 TaxID=1121393 RepID=A0A1M6YLB8_9BACT|nr:ATP-binding protein [Desulfatibacillum alkenivorans]SHL19068.1 ATP-dependent DNA helicase RecG [Desulfatibacillum alkenivorans DSM 16219]
MRSAQDILDLLQELETEPADYLEDQDLDFKEWIPRSMNDSLNLVIEMAVCMANGGGGVVVFGVRDHVTGREKAILGVPPEIDVNRLKKAVYDSTDPKLTPNFEEIRVPEGTGRLLVMTVFPGLPPYTDTSGKGKVRVGKDCQPLTGTMRRRIMVETGETDFTAERLNERPEELISAAALETLVNAARREKAPEDLLRADGMDILAQLGVIQDGQMTRAGVLLCGTEKAISKYIPGYGWTHLRMQSDTRYTDRADGRDALLVALSRIMDRINADNPIFTLEQGLFHFEYRTYPEIALREAVANALCHADFRIAGPILVKQGPDKLEISNPGGFIAGITPENILHHQPAARNPLLVDALAKLRLVNRSNLGVGRMFEALLIEGKEPPVIHESGDSVALTFMRREFSREFRLFVAEESQKGRALSLDQLLVLQYVLAHPEIDSATAAGICQRPEQNARGIMDGMERLGYVERGGAGRGTYWTLHSDLHQKIAAPGDPDRDRRIDWEAAKTRVLSVLMERARRGNEGLNNTDIRRITHYDRNQVRRLMMELMKENDSIQKEGERRWTRYVYSM